MGNVVICKWTMSNLRTIVIIRIMIIITIIAIITTYNKIILESIKVIVLTHEERASVGLPGVVLGVPLPDKCVNICRGRQSWLKYVNSEHCDAFYSTILLWWSHSNTARRKNVRGGDCVFLWKIACVNCVWGSRQTCRPRQTWQCTEKHASTESSGLNPQQLLSFPIVCSDGATASLQGLVTVSQRSTKHVLNHFT